MSRHRHIRNLDYDDFLDELENDDFDDPHDYDEPEPEPYAHDEQENQQQPDGEYLDDLVAHFRNLLSDQNLSPDTIDTAIVAADYDIEAALEMLREQREAEKAIAEKVSSPLEREPSPIGKMLDDDDDEPSYVKMPPPSTTRANHDIISVNSGAVIRRKPGEVTPFLFDKPSPDDAVKQLQGMAGRRAKAVRFPKASTLRVTKNKEESARPGSSSVPSSSSTGAKDTNTKVDVKSTRQSNSVHHEEKTIVKEKKMPLQRIKKVDLSSRLKKDYSVTILVAGHVDAGKSTLICHMLEQLQTGRDNLKKTEGRQLAWGTDEDAIERERGVTIDIATRVFERHGRKYALIDAPGHKDFVPAMILGAAQASIALLVVDASPGEFEAGMSDRGQTREHAIVLKALGVQKIVVVVNKMDVIDWSKDRFEEVKRETTRFLKGCGWHVGKAVHFIPTSGREGINLFSLPKGDHPLNHWWVGKSLLQYIESIRGIDRQSASQSSSKPTRLVVSDFFRSVSLGGDGAVTGRLISGSLSAKDKLFLSPGGNLVTVKNVEVGSVRSSVAAAGADSLPVSLGLFGLPDGIIIKAGSVLCDPEHPVPIVEVFKAQMLTTAADALLTPGTQGILHVGGGRESVIISQLCEYTGGKKKGKKPRRLLKGDKAIIEFCCDRPMALETGTETKGLSRFAFRQDGMTVGVGVINEIVQTVKEPEIEDSSGQDG